MLQEDAVHPAVEEAIVGVNNTQQQLASALQTLEAERSSLMDKASLAGSLAMHERVSEQMAAKQWQQAEIEAKLADLHASGGQLSASASRNNAQQVLPSSLW